MCGGTEGGSLPVGARMMPHGGAGPSGQGGETDACQLFV